MTVVITTVAVERRWMEYRMHQFQCGHQECFSQFSSPSKDDLMRQVADHLREVHNVEKATQTLLRYLESTCVTSQP
jgi:predicted small metal-binding protein